VTGPPPPRVDQGRPVLLTLLQRHKASSAVLRSQAPAYQGFFSMSAS